MRKVLFVAFLLKKQKGNFFMKVAWKAITDYDVECLVKNYGLTETELHILQLRRQGVGAEAVPFKIYYQRN
jgi:hypothetical protein